MHFIHFLSSISWIVILKWQLTADAQPSKVHFVSSCHLDVGYADTAANVVNRYFDKYYAASMNTSEVLRHRGGDERFVFLTHTYLVSLYLDCPPNMGIHCPAKEETDAFLAAVRRGDIVWHALPFNSELELLDSSMLQFSVQLTHDLDALTGRNRTITMSQRDVPGMTRSVIPLLKSAGVEAITVGVNSGSMPPGVPDIFRWKDPVSGESIMAMWHPDGYGGANCCKATDAVVASGMPDALMYGVRNDNSGPAPVDQVISDWAAIRKLFPSAEIVASDYDSFVRAALPYLDQLPVYDKEIGDTWIYGVPSDPFKTAAARVMMSLRSQCLASGKCDIKDSQVYNFSRLLIKASEHTWGLEYVGHLKDNINFKNDKFHAVMHNQNYVAIANSWREQRDWAIHYAMDALGDHQLAEQLQTELDMIRNVPAPDTSGYSRITDTEQVFTIGDVKIAFSSRPFSISHLEVGGALYASANTSTRLAALLYQSFSAADFDTFMSHYMYKQPWGDWDGSFGKPGLKNVSGVEHQEIYADLVALWHWQGNDDSASSSSSFLAQLSFPSSLVKDYGAPADVWLTIAVSSDAIQLSINLLNKTATRLPESISLQFRPLARNTSSMTMEKLGEVVSVLDVGFNGSKHIHGVGCQGISYQSDPGLNFVSKHVPIVCIGQPTPFPTPMEQPDVSAGFSYNIVNNIWGTNYVMWYPFDEDSGDGSFRSDFTIQLPR